MLTQWIHKGVFTPINELNIAMQKIKDGNFDHMLQTDAKGEIGDLYRNYEDMRLRLKESAEEKRQHESQNKELISKIPPRRWISILRPSIIRQTTWIG